jgi:uncharacterized protein YdiU (UPF0061 family)
MKKLNQTYLQLNESMYSFIGANKFKDHEILYINRQCAIDFSFDQDFLVSKEGIDLFVGNQSEFADDYIAQAYCGHQYGHFNILGDGRAMLIGDFDVDGQTYDIQLKGSGRTPYSRGGDGLGTTSSMMRELLISEAMHSLGVMTTRSLLVMKTGNNVLRNKVEEGAILTRIARSHLRVGTFQYARMLDDKSQLAKLADFAINRHYKHLKEKKDKYRLLLRSVIEAQAKLIAKWQSIGFIHGVMNTDNMTISGETIDYGPCAFMNAYDLETVYSQIDRNGRYAFGNQPYIAAWNLSRFAETLIPLLSDDEEEAYGIANNELVIFKELFEQEWLEQMAAKLGIIDYLESDKVLIDELLSLMSTYKQDYTNTFRLLSKTLVDRKNPLNSNFASWYEKWINRIESQGVVLSEIQAKMQKVNPYVIPRNAWIEKILNTDSLILVDQFLEVFKNPYDYSGKLDEHLDYPEKNDYFTHCNT